ncbi:thiosulfate reductase cytochrome subunit beta [Microbacterium sp. HM58-2]|nr:thiosulfate reductase cytochrome subunit beta [Microbacterium sp. HM58-2]
MATRMLRRGLPRVPGGEPWPPADAVAEVVDDAVAPTAAAPDPEVASGPEVAADVVPATVRQEGAVAPAVERPIRDEDLPAAVASIVASSPVGAAGAGGTTLRRGLPRVRGGEPWPPAGAAPGPDGAARLAAVAHDAKPVAAASAVPPASAAARGAETPDAGQNTSSAPAGGVSASGAAATEAAPGPAAGAEPRVDRASAVRRGLPRVPGGEPWPPAGTAPLTAAAAVPAAVPVDSSVPVAQSVESEPVEATLSATGARDAGALEAAAPARDLSTPLPWTRTVWDGRAPRHVAAPAASGRFRPTWTQAIAGLFGAAALGVLAGAAVAFVRALLSLPFMQDFLAAFPGEYEPAVHVEPGFAPWIGWQHFFNVFLMVLIIRSGLRIRGEKRPTAFWTPRNNPKGKVSLTIWFHQALDVLWLVNGVVFVVLLFATGHWVRIVPTSWEVFPNALSAALQYVSFDWPHENGWNNYNSLQQLAYFATVFLAAPLAAVTGFRMSGMWPKKAEGLSKAYPVEWARAVHFPVMLYFVTFIAVHVALVFLTGFLRNLNHMYASQDAVTWTGFWVFVASLAVIAAGWAAARPLVIAPVAKLFGTVSGR